MRAKPGTKLRIAALMYQVENPKGNASMIRSSKGSVLVVSAVLIMLARAADADPKPPASPSNDASVPKARRLDLRPPPITKLYTAEQISRLLARTFDQDIEGVEVEGARALPSPVTPTVWGGIAAPFWAIFNPTQAWRIFAPLPPDQTRGMQNHPPDATNTFLEPAAPLHP